MTDTNVFAVFTAELTDLDTLERSYRIACENQRQAWREYSREETQACLMTALAADRAQKDAYEARERWYIDNMYSGQPHRYADAEPELEPVEYEDDHRSELYYGY